jgi:RIO-like serine/threonine protein kinase
MDIRDSLLCLLTNIYHVQVEAGSRNHEVVPTPLISQLSGLRGGSGVHRSISNLAKTNLIAKVKNAKCTLNLSHIVSDPFAND